MNLFKKAFATVSDFCSDMLREKKGCKFSSKKAWGHVIMLLVGITYIFDGLHWYSMNVAAFNTMIFAGCTLIGLKTVKEILKKDLPKSE